MSSACGRAMQRVCCTPDDALQAAWGDPHLDLAGAHALPQLHVGLREVLQSFLRQRGVARCLCVLYVTHTHWPTHPTLPYPTLP